MYKIRTLFGFILAVFMVAGIALPCCGAAKQGNPQTSITKLRVLLKGNRTCLIFDAEGAEPKQIGPASANGISVFFSQITAKFPDRVIADRRSAAKEVKFRRESGFFEVLFRESNTTVSSKEEPGKNGKYTLTLELTPAGKAGSASIDPEPKSNLSEKPRELPPLETKKVQTADLFGSRVAQQIKGAVLNPQLRIDGESPRPARSDSKSRDFVEPDASALALYSSANEKFESCSRNLVFCAPEIIEEYDQALKAGPRSSQAPLAIYRIALANSIMGSYTKADKLFRRVTSDWPDHPIASRCWVGIGDIYNKKQSYLEAMEAFRWALRGAVQSDDKAEAYFELGNVFLVLGANKEALEMLNNCMGQQPDFYMKKPEIFRFIGEAYFGLGDVEKAKEPLLKYLNIQESAPDQDIALAKLAEIFLIQGDRGAAGKIYSFIRKYYKDSEGDLICWIREGELCEKDNLEQAIKIYDDLRSKDISPSLRRIVLMKLATLNLKTHDFGHSLDLMDEAFPVKNDGSSPPGTSELRERILCDLIKQLYSDKDFVKVVQLHEKYRRVFDSMQAPDILGQIAESYASLKFYSNALTIYDKLISKGQKKGEDLLLRCALYALCVNDNGRSSQFCKMVQSEAMDLKKSEILGHLFYRDQKYAEAVKAFGKVLQKGKEFEIEEPDSYVAYGYCLFNTNKFDEAVPVLQKAMLRAKADDGSARRSILVKLGKCFVEQKQYQQAAETMDAAIRVSGEDQANELLYEISKLYIAAGQKDKAIQSLNKLKGTEQPFWAAMAQQQLNTIDMNQANATP
jgi:tetratricopeptide (TPR) repeat protein